MIWFSFNKSAENSCMCRNISNAIQGDFWFNCSWLCICLLLYHIFPPVIQYFSQGSLEFHLVFLVHRYLKQKETGGTVTPLHIVTSHFCCGARCMLSTAWIMSQVPQKSFTTICVCRSCGECGMPGTFSGSSWPGQMVWLKLPPLPPSTRDQTP